MDLEQSILAEHSKAQCKRITDYIGSNRLATELLRGGIPGSDQALQKLVKDYPEIAPELITIIEDRWDQETPAFQVRARRLLKSLKK